MSPHSSMQKVLIIGSGPIRIGQTGALDDAACRACDVFRQAGLQTVMVHSDPSALATDVDVADRTYMVPLSGLALTEIILKEKPDALLPTVGGPAALRLAKALAGSGLLDEKGIRLLGASAKSLAVVDDPGAFFDTAARLGLAFPEGEEAASVADAAAMAETIGYPVFVRAAEAGTAMRYGIAFNIEELRHLAAGGRLPSDAVGRFRVETALSGCVEVEATLLRDNANRRRMVAMAENLDPVGIHSGDSTVVFPPQTIDRKTLDAIQAAALALAAELAVTGIVHFKFAVDPNDRRVLPLAVDTGYCRMAAFLAIALDASLPDIHARLCLGMDLDMAIAGDDDRLHPAMRSDRVAVRLPRWEFERFPGETPRLDAHMKSTGAVMGLGQTFSQAYLKALRARSPHHPMPRLPNEMASWDADRLMHRLVSASPDRLAVIHAALGKGADPQAVAAATGIGIEWIRQLADLADLDRQIGAAASSSWPAPLAERALQAGLDACILARRLHIPEAAAVTLLSAANARSVPRPVVAGDPARIWFNAPSAPSAPAPLGKSVLIVAPGIARIGQSIELDHCCAHGAKSLRAAGRRVVMVGANPAPACGAAVADRLYVEPLTAEDIGKICRTESPEGVILQFGGYRAMDLAPALLAAGHAVLGTPPSCTALCRDRIAFSRRLTDLGIPHPQIAVADAPDAAMDLAEAIGYPLLAGSPADYQGRRRTIIMDQRMLERHVMETGVCPEAPLLLEQFLEYAIEAEADALCDGQGVYVPAVMEHIELAGVHSGDAAMVVPPYSTPPRHIETIAAIIDKIAPELGVKGVFNTRFAVLNDTVYLLELRPWACRTLPMVSKVCNVPMAQRAVAIMLGMTLEEMDLPRCLLPHYAIRSSVFPFDTFTESDPLLGPRMHATGQAMVIAKVFGMAYFTSQEAAGPPLPLGGNVLITVTDTDKPSILEPARLFKDMGFGIQATRGTHAFLKKNGIQAQMVKKLGFGRPDLVDGIKTGDVSLVVNTPSGSQSQQDDAYIRKTANRYRIPNVTTPAAALAAAKGIAARKRGQDALCTLQSYVRAIK